MRQDLRRARFLRRYKRFFADVELDGEVVVAHCPNTGTMKTLLEEGAPAWIRTSDDPKRKLAHSLVLLGVPGGRAIVDTALPNRIVEEALHAGVISSLTGYATVRREVKVGEKSRIDLVLEESERGAPDCYIEVKNVTMRADDHVELPPGSGSLRADFPDAVTERGRKHLGELMRLVDQGHRAVQLYFLGRDDCDHVGVADAIDPAYGETVREAMAHGVEFIAVRARIEGGESEASGAVALTVGEECLVEI